MAPDSAPTVVIDLGFDELMSDREIASLVQQLAYAYSSNRRAGWPVSWLNWLAGLGWVGLDSNFEINSVPASKEYIPQLQAFRDLTRDSTTVRAGNGVVLTDGVNASQSSCELGR